MSIRDMIAAGQAKIAKAAADAEAEKAAKEKAENDIKDTKFAPLWAAACELIPPELRANLDPQRSEFKSDSNHQMIISVPGLAPIEVSFEVGSWTKAAPDWIGVWRLEGTITSKSRDKAFRVASYDTYLDEDDGYKVHAVCRRDWTHFDDLDVAIAKAHESEQKRLELEAECVTRNAERVARLARFEAEPTREEALVEALRQWVLSVIPEPVS